VRLVLVYEMPPSAKASAMQDIEDWVAAGRLKHRVAHLLPLADVAYGHELIERGGFRGAVVLQVR